MSNNRFDKIKKAQLITPTHTTTSTNTFSSTNEIDINKLVNYVDSDGNTNDDIFGLVTEESILNLAKGIEESGFKTAIEVWRLDDGKYMIYSGHRRFSAAKYLGYTKVKCDIYDYPQSEEERRLQFLRANIHTRGSIKATTEGGDIYIAKQIKYLENILRKQGIKSQTEIDKIVCKEFNAKKNTVWKYKSLLKACDELIEAESKGHILIEQAASICVFNKQDQKTIVTAIMDYVDKGTKFVGKDLDALVKKLHEADNIQDKDVHNNVSISDVSSFIADILVKTQEENKEEEPKQIKVKNLATYDKYSLRINSLKKDIINNRINDLKPEEVKNLIYEFDNVKDLLDTQYLFSELMSGIYNGIEIHNDTIIDEKDLSKFNLVQLKKLQEIYEDVKGFENIIAQINTAETNLKAE